jgi:hypothetical protein
MQKVMQLAQMMEKAGDIGNEVKKRLAGFHQKDK